MGKLKQPYAREGCRLYLERLNHLMPAKIDEIKESGKKAPGPRISEEAKRIIKAMDKRAATVALTRAGKKLNSEQVADLILDEADKGKSEMMFIVGGPEGLAKEVIDKADFRLSFSRMTFPHELARLLLLEQLYRAVSIIKGTAYHRKGVTN